MNQWLRRRTAIDAENLIGLIVAVLLLGFLLYALFAPEGLG